jgi:hypothetical protein
MDDFIIPVGIDRDVVFGRLDHRGMYDYYRSKFSIMAFEAKNNGNKRGDHAFSSPNNNLVHLYNGVFLWTS